LTQESKVSLPRKIGYALGLYGITVAYICVGTLLVYCYTEVFKIPPSLAAAVFTFGAVVDFLFSLILPWWAVRHNSRLGRYRAFLIYGSVPLGVSFALLFMQPSLTGPLLIVYTFAAQAFFRMAYSVAVMSHASMISRLSSDANERASIGSIKGVGSGLGTLTSAYLGLSAVHWFGGSDEVSGFAYFGLVFGAIAAVALLISGLCVREEVEDLSGEGDTRSLGLALRLLLRNDQALIALGATVVFFIGLVAEIGSIAYMFKYVLAFPEGTQTAIVMLALGAVISPPIWRLLISRTSKSMTWSLGCVLIVSALMTLYFADISTTTIYALYFVCGFGQGAVIMNYFAIIADAIDYGHWKSGQRTEAYGFGMLALFTKAGDTLGAAVLSALLGWAGLSLAPEPTAEVIGRLHLVVTAAPACLILASGVIMFFLNIPAHQHRQMIDDIRSGRFRKVENVS
jgi:glycoside/pentoside/hexuronide:cation symporter, GPH family